MAVALLGCALRLWDLGARPMHTDEAVNAYIVGQTLAGEPFHYDRADRHGPALAALAVPLARAQGAHSFSELTEAKVRVTSVLAGTATLLLFCVAVDMFGFAVCLIGAGITAIAPLPVYYDRYFIHEPLLAAATFLFLLAAWRLWQKPSIWRATLAGTAAALMAATKETAVINLSALGLAALVCRLWPDADGEAKQLPGVRMAVAAGTAFLLVLLAFYTWFGRDWQGLSQLLHAGPRLLARAGGEGHAKPFWYYGQMLAAGWSGALLCGLAGVGALAALGRGARPAHRLLTLYALILLCLYSLVPYKTPWLALELWVPFALLAGLAIQMICRNLVRNTSEGLTELPVLLALGFGALMLTVALAIDTRRRVFVAPAAEDNPYAYAHTSEDLTGLPAAIDRLVREGGISSPRIAVIAADPWPLPWYLRGYSQTGYWQPGQDPGVADFYITSTEAAGQYRRQLRDLRPEFFGVRPGVLILVWSRDHE